MRMGWDLSNPDIRNEASRLIDESCPCLVIGRSPRTAFSTLQRMNNKKWSVDENTEKDMEKA